MSRFISIAEARAASGLRMACLRAIPSPWTEAAKGIFHVKGLHCQYAAQSADEVAVEKAGGENAIAAWAGDSSIPVVAFENEPLRTGYEEILLLAERLAPEPSLIPEDPRERAKMFGLSREVCGELGVGWCLRLLMLKASFDHSDETSVPASAAGRLAAKYGFNPTDVRQAEDRVAGILGLLDEALGEGPCFFGDRLTALDIYWATMANLLTPLDEDLLPMSGYMRKVYTSRNERLLEALTPALREHQQRIYQDHLELPVPL